VHTLGAVPAASRTTLRLFKPYDLPNVRNVMCSCISHDPCRWSTPAHAGTLRQSLGACRGVPVDILQESCRRQNTGIVPCKLEKGLRFHASSKVLRTVVVSGSTRLHTTKSASCLSQVRPPQRAGGYTASCLYHASSKAWIFT
jgi:hypothetical protein